MLNYRQFIVLYVDDEELSLKSFARAFGDQFQILTANSAEGGLRLIDEHADRIAVLMTDQRMPGMKGVNLLEQARQIQPRILRILVTAYADIEAAVQAVNSGAIYKYVHKPWDPPSLETLLRRAIEFFQLQRERDQLLKEKTSLLRNMMVADRLVSLGLLAAGLSHHIRNSLVSVKTFLDLAPIKLAEEGVDPAALRHADFWGEYLDSVQGQIDRINGLLRDLWLASENPAFEFKDVVCLHDVVAMAQGRLSQRLEEKGLILDNLVPPDLPPLTVNHQRFARLFELLLEDELVSLPPGSRIVFRARADLTNPAEPWVRVEMEDNGPGLPEQELRFLFNPFVVRNSSPSEYGLRLMTCFFIVHQHGGKIIARSSGQKGTTFALRLPLRPDQLPMAEENEQFLESLFFNEERLEDHLSGG